MFNVPAPIGDFFVEFKVTAEAKLKSEYKEALKLVESDIEKRYQEYQDNLLNLEKVTQIVRGDNEKKALESCYSQGLKDRLEADLRARIAASTKYADLLAGGRTIRCPYCQMEPAGRWDHFLPSSLYPDFFMYSPNLLYICEKCNNDIKKNGLVSPERSTINPYYDNIDKYEYLSCRVNLDKVPSVSFYVSCPVGGDNYLANVIERHFVAYGLKKKFEGEASSKISRLITYFEDSCEIYGGMVNQERLDKILNMELDLLRKIGHGSSHWEVVMWKALKKCDKLLDCLAKNFASGGPVVAL